MKKILATLMFVVLGLVCMSEPALADWGSGRGWGGSSGHRRGGVSSGRHWAGAAFALGALGFFTVLEAVQPRVSVGYPGYDYPDPCSGPPVVRPERVWEPGRWETVQVWVPEHGEQVWEPARYDGYGRYWRGHFVPRRVGGRYEPRQVWQEGRRR